MPNYVKFLRGTPTAYANLAIKDDDTLYFIYEQDKSNGVLYLGSKQIAGSADSGTPSNPILSLDELSDVIISELGEKPSLLVYDKNSQAWVNKNLDELIFVGATENSSGQSGLVPAPGANEGSLFLRGDGTWAIPSVNHTILTLENNNNVTHEELLS